MITLAALRSALRPSDDECRIQSGKQMVAIAGAVGCIKSDLSVNLRLAALHGAAKQAAIDLYDSGILNADAVGQPYLARMPANFTERRLLRLALGLRSQKDEQ
jgi:hypothetical protein